MQCDFIKPILNKKIPSIKSYEHRKFTKFGIGKFIRDELKITNKKNSLVIKAGPDYVDSFLRFIADRINSLNDVEIKGLIYTPLDIKDKLSNFDIEFQRKAKKYIIKEINKEIFKEMIKDITENIGNICLFNVQSKELTFKTKDKFPKKGKPAKNFCSLVINDTKIIDDFKNEFLYFIDSDFKKLIIQDTIEINDIVLEEKVDKDDYLKQRLYSRRIGKLIREITGDINKTIEKEFKI